MDIKGLKDGQNLAGNIPYNIDQSASLEMKLIGTLTLYPPHLPQGPHAEVFREVCHKVARQSCPPP